MLQSNECSHANFVPQSETGKPNASSAPIILVPFTAAFRFVCKRASNRLVSRIGCTNSFLSPAFIKSKFVSKKFVRSTKSSKVRSFRFKRKYVGQHKALASHLLFYIAEYLKITARRITLLDNKSKQENGRKHWFTIMLEGSRCNKPNAPSKCSNYLYHEFCPQLIKWLFRLEPAKAIFFQYLCPHEDVWHCHKSRCFVASLLGSRLYFFPGEYLCQSALMLCRVALSFPARHLTWDFVFLQSSQLDDFSNVGWLKSMSSLHIKIMLICKINAA